MRKIISLLITLILSVLLSLFLYHQMTIEKLLTKIGGFSVLSVSSGSMQPELNVGDIIIIKECDHYNVDDIITYNVDNQYLITHRIIEKDGNNYVLKGDFNNTKDNCKVTKENIEGKVIFNSKLLKLLYNHWIICILVIFLLLILL